LLKTTFIQKIKTQTAQLELLCSLLSCFLQLRLSVIH